jgi:hypothetical protein
VNIIFEDIAFDQSASLLALTKKKSPKLRNNISSKIVSKKEHGRASSIQYARH